MLHSAPTCNFLGLSPPTDGMARRCSFPLLAPVFTAALDTVLGQHVSCMSAVAPCKVSNESDEAAHAVSNPCDKIGPSYPIVLPNTCMVTIHLFSHQHCTERCEQAPVQAMLCPHV